MIAAVFSHLIASAAHALLQHHQESARRLRLAADRHERAANEIRVLTLSRFGDEQHDEQHDEHDDERRQDMPPPFVVTTTAPPAPKLDGDGDDGDEE